MFRTLLAHSQTSLALGWMAAGILSSPAHSSDTRRADSRVGEQLVSFENTYFEVDHSHRTPVRHGAGLRIERVDSSEDFFQGTWFVIRDGRNVNNFKVVFDCRDASDRSLSGIQFSDPEVDIECQEVVSTALRRGEVDPGFERRRWRQVKGASHLIWINVGTRTVYFDFLSSLGIPGASVRSGGDAPTVINKISHP